MTIVIIEDNERLPFTMDGATYYYRRMPSDTRSALVKKYTTTIMVDGKPVRETDWDAVARMTLEYCLRDWEGVVNGAGESVPYEAKLISRIPDAHQVAILNKLGVPVLGEAERKN
jgi:hypothetical protein